jgi:hypothetical protein
MNCRSGLRCNDDDDDDDNNADENDDEVSLLSKMLGMLLDFAWAICVDV